MDEEDKSIKKAYQLAGLGIVIAVQAVAGALVGYLLDQKLHTQPWLLLLGTVGSFLLGLRALFSALKKFK